MNANSLSMLVGAALLALSGVAAAQGTSIGIPQGSGRAASDPSGYPSSGRAAVTPPASIRRSAPLPVERENASRGSDQRKAAACLNLAGPEKQECLRGTGRAHGGTASGAGGTPDRVGPGSTGMGR